jgi:hypothetical protein
VNKNCPENTIKTIIAEINSLTATNAEITKAGGFFTAEQVANEKKSWALKMNLRFNHGMEARPEKARL